MAASTKGSLLLQLTMLADAFGLMCADAARPDCTGISMLPQSMLRHVQHWGCDMAAVGCRQYTAGCSPMEAVVTQSTERRVCAM